MSLDTSVSVASPSELTIVTVFPSCGIFAYTNCNPLGILSVISVTNASKSPSLYALNVYNTYSPFLTFSASLFWVYSAVVDVPSTSFFVFIVGSIFPCLDNFPSAE